MFTEVFNLSTGETLLYSLPVMNALIAACEKYDRKNSNTWTYPKAEDVKFVIGNKTIGLGNFAVVWC